MKNKKEASVFPLILLTLSVVAAAIYAVMLFANVTIEGRDYACNFKGNIRYRMDYFFPARQLSCYLYEEVGEKK